MILKVQVLDGKGFGQETQALVCCASFAGAAKTTQYSVAAEEHIWNSTLNWSISKEELRSATSNTNHCKISVLRRDGTSLGWVVISLRSAKLQGQYRSDPEGTWLQLNASRSPLSEPPQLRVAYSLLDERHLPAAQQRQSPIILQHNDSSSSLASDHSGSSSGSSGTDGSKAAYFTASVEASNTAASRKQGGRAGQAGGAVAERRAAAASLRPSMGDSRARRLSAAAAAGGGEGAGALVVAEAADSGGGELPTAAGAASVSITNNSEHLSAEALQDQHKQPPAAGVGVDERAGPTEDGDAPGAAAVVESLMGAAAAAAGPALLAAGSSQQQQVGPAPDNTLGTNPVLLEQPQPHTPQQQQSQLQQQQQQTQLQQGGHGDLPDHPSSGTAVAPGHSNSSQQPEHVGNVLAAEASLPSFAQRQQQQQHSLEQQMLLHLQQPPPQQQQQQQQELQQVTDRSLECRVEQQAVAVDTQQLLQHQAALPGTDPDLAVTAHNASEGAAADAQAQASLSGVAAEPSASSAAVGAFGEPPRPAAAAGTVAVAEQATAQLVAAVGASSPAAAEQPVALCALGPAGAEGAAPHQPSARTVQDDATSVMLSDPVRSFALTLDVRSFQAGRRLPVALGSIYVTAWLPQELIGFLVNQCGAKLPPRITPLKTKPAVDIPRGSEGALPAGTASVSFACGVMVLAELLAGAPKVTLEVYHKERLRSDLLLGVASVPLSALLQECWVDGYAPVYAIMTKASGSSNNSQQQQASAQGGGEQVQVGLLRVVMSLEEKGPASMRTAGEQVTAAPVTPSKQRLQQQSPSRGRHVLQLGGKVQQSPSRPAAETGAAVTAVAAAAVDAAAAAAGSSSGPQSFRQMPEYLAAWELEVWRKAEEAHFRAQLQELEQQRMGVIEAAWRAREAQRQAEIAAMKAKYATLEKQTRDLLTATQERERSLLAAESELRLRKAELERQAAARMTEGEAAIRRLQVDCEHQLGLERERTAAALKQRDAADARTAALESQFTQFVASQRNATESQLRADLAEAQRALKAAEGKLRAVVKLKQKYKQQVQQLARELAALHHKHQQDLLQQHQQQLAAAISRERGNLAATQQAELAAVRDELGRLRAATVTADPGPFDTWGGVHRVSAAAAAAAAPDSPSTCSSSSWGSTCRPQGQLQRTRDRRHQQGKENQASPAGGLHPPKQYTSRHHHRSGPAPAPQAHWEEQQQRQMGLYGSDGDGGSDRDGQCSSGSSSDAGSDSLAAERSAQEATVEVATLAAMLNPPREPNADRQGGSSKQDGSSLEAKAAKAHKGGSSCGSPMTEVRRLLKEKAELLATGLYTRDDVVIMQIDARVQALAELAAAV